MNAKFGIGIGLHRSSASPSLPALVNQKISPMSAFLTKKSATSNGGTAVYEVLSVGFKYIVAEDGSYSVTTRNDTASYAVPRHLKFVVTNLGSGNLKVVSLHADNAYKVTTIGDTFLIERLPEPGENENNVHYTVLRAKDTTSKVFGLGSGRSKQRYEAGTTRLDGMPEAIDAYDVGIFLHELEAIEGKNDGKDEDLWDVCDHDLSTKPEETLEDWEKI